MEYSKTVQIVPCKYPMITAYRGQKCAIGFIEDVKYMALKENGDLVGLTFGEGVGDSMEEASNFIGTFTADAAGIKQMLGMLGLENLYEEEA